MTSYKISVIGKGTAGCMTAAYFAKLQGTSIDWYFDPKIKTQAVGEGSNLTLPIRLKEAFNFSTRDHSKIDGTVKTGIYKEDWGKTGKPFLHDFPNPTTALHFNAIKLQDYACDRLKDHVNIIEKNVKAEDLDSDYIIDCSGKPSTYEDYNMSSYIPVNSVYVTQCYWDFPKFNYTLTIARPYGWVFGIPLSNRCSIGYMYNSDITTLEEVMLDVQNIFDKYGLEPSKDTNAFSFHNYKRKNNFLDNVAYNGNASFFLEPLEATSFSTVDNINCIARELLHTKDFKLAERKYNAVLDANENIIMLHYSVGSSFNTPFWDYAEERGRKCLEQADESFKFMLENSHMPTGLQSYEDAFLHSHLVNKTPEIEALYSAWWQGSFAQNKIGLGLESYY